MTLTQRPFEVRTLQQVKPDKFKEGSEEGIRLDWEEAKAYKADNGLGGDQGVLVDRAQEEYATDIGYGEMTYELSQKYAEWSATATV
eukprot:12182658-Karenia_brevis.AAC.1